MECLTQAHRGARQAVSLIGVAALILSHSRRADERSEGCVDVARDRVRNQRPRCRVQAMMEPCVNCVGPALPEANLRGVVWMAQRNRTQ
jgi:hypothetical protein